MSNPFLTPSTLPYQLPPFGLIRDEHYLPAFEAGFTEHLAEIDAIVSNPEPADFHNTVVALEQAGQTLRRAALVFYNRSAAHSTEAIQELDTRIAPQYAAHEDNIYLNRALFERVCAVSTAGLDAESARLTDEYRKRFIRAGAQLDDASQERLRELNSQLSELSTAFGQKLLKDTNASALLVDEASKLDGLSEDDIASAASAAEAAGHPGQYLLTLILPSAQPALESLTDRDVRRELHTASVNRGFRDNEFNTLDTAVRMAELRAERAALLGFANHAEAATDDQTAPSLDAI